MKKIFVPVIIPLNCFTNSRLMLFPWSVYANYGRRELLLTRRAKPREGAMSRRKAINLQRDESDGDNRYLNSAPPNASLYDESMLGLSCIFQEIPIYFLN